MPNDDIMAVKELADYLKIAEKAVYQFSTNDYFLDLKVGNAWRFRKDKIDVSTLIRTNSLTVDTSNASVFDFAKEIIQIPMALII